MDSGLTRSLMILGKEKIEMLKNSKVAIFGIGGVGSYVLEALSRIGIGKFVLIDGDNVDISNINRQIIATYNTIGRAKVEIAKERVLSINPKADVEIHKIFYLPGQNEDIINGCNYVVDAIDTVSAKISIICISKKKKIKSISCMSCGNKLDPTGFKIEDIYNTSVCPLCKVMRKELKKRGILSQKVLYSKEEPVKQICESYGSNENKNFKKPILGSVSFVPSVAGLIIASEVVKDITLNK